MNSRKIFLMKTGGLSKRVKANCRYNTKKTTLNSSQLHAKEYPHAPDGQCVEEVYGDKLKAGGNYTPSAL
jgi:hypothetical protein